MATTRQKHVITGNLLREGTVVYLAADRRWVRRIEHAAWLEGEAARDVELGWARAQGHEVCGVYAIDVGLDEAGRPRLSARERFRAAGATDVRRRLGVGTA